jgi:hypothetical protein
MAAAAAPKRYISASGVVRFLVFSAVVYAAVYGLTVGTGLHTRVPLVAFALVRLCKHVVLSSGCGVVSPFPPPTSSQCAEFGWLLRGGNDAYLRGLGRVDSGRHGLPWSGWAERGPAHQRSAHTRPPPSPRPAVSPAPSPPHPRASRTGL